MFIKTFKEGTKHILICYVDDVLSIGRKEQVKEFQFSIDNAQCIRMTIRRKREGKKLFYTSTRILVRNTKRF